MNELTVPQKGVPIAMAEPSIHTHEEAALKPPIQKWEDMPGIGESISKILDGMHSDLVIFVLYSTEGCICHNYTNNFEINCILSVQKYIIYYIKYKN